jgi:hypothetical protein
LCRSLPTVDRQVMCSPMWVGTYMRALRPYATVITVGHPSLWKSTPIWIDSTMRSNGTSESRLWSLTELSFRARKRKSTIPSEGTRMQPSGCATSPRGSRRAAEAIRPNVSLVSSSVISGQ